MSAPAFSSSETVTDDRSMCPSIRLPPGEEKGGSPRRGRTSQHRFVIYPSAGLGGVGCDGIASASCECSMDSVKKQLRAVVAAEVNSEYTYEDVVLNIVRHAAKMRVRVGGLSLEQ